MAEEGSESFFLIFDNHIISLEFYDKKIIIIYKYTTTPTYYKCKKYENTSADLIIRVGRNLDRPYGIRKSKKEA